MSEIKHAQLFCLWMSALLRNANHMFSRCPVWGDLVYFFGTGMSNLIQGLWWPTEQCITKESLDFSPSQLIFTMKLGEAFHFLLQQRGLQLLLISYITYLNNLIILVERCFCQRDVWRISLPATTKEMFAYYALTEE